MLLTRKALLSSLERFDQSLEGHHTMTLIGGSALLLLGLRDLARDVDIIHHNFPETLELPLGYNDTCRFWVPHSPLWSNTTAWEGVNLTVLIPTPERLLEQKIHAQRYKDLPDITSLAKHMGLSTMRDFLSWWSRTSIGPLPPTVHFHLQYTLE